MKNTCLYCGIELPDYADVCNQCIQDIKDEKETIAAVEEENWRIANNFIERNDTQ